jgi:hypothetical protein
MPVHGLHKAQDGVAVGSALDQARLPTDASSLEQQIIDLFVQKQLGAMGTSRPVGTNTSTGQTVFGSPRTAATDEGFTDIECLPAPLNTLLEGVPACPEEPDGGGGGGGGSIRTPVIPPVLELLAERRLRRGQEAANLLEAAQQAPPPGATVFPGFEANGLADVLMGLITGKGVEASKGLIPGAARKIIRQPLPSEPSIESELPASLEAAQKILDAIRVV